jgi:hypothetical protein
MAVARVGGRLLAATVAPGPHWATYAAPGQFPQDRGRGPRAPVAALTGSTRGPSGGPDGRCQRDSDGRRGGVGRDPGARVVVGRQSAARPSPLPASPRWSSVLAPRPASTSRPIRTCCAMPAASPWPTPVMTRGHFKRISPSCAGQRVEVNKALASAGRGFPVGIAGPRRRAFGGA